VLHGQREEGPHQIGIASGDQLPAAPVELDLGAAPLGQHPDAVELDLEEPSLAGGRAVAERRQHEGLGAGQDLAPRSAERLQVPADGLLPARHVGDFFHRETRENGLRIPVGQLLAGRGAVRFLEQQPVPVLPRHAGERPPPA
jgi:hypothetical protein